MTPSLPTTLPTLDRRSRQHARGACARSPLPCAAAALRLPIPWFTRRADPRVARWRLVHAQAELVIGDPTAVERPQARTTADGETRNDGTTRGCWTLV
ncbi:MAG: hypothetical protein C0183_00235, partial [Roseiflexus castenholzii]